jgi:hypothetical protein
VALGDVAGDVALPFASGCQFFLGPLNDTGRLLFAVGAPSGSRPDVLIQYQDGVFTRIAAPGMDGPLGKWPQTLLQAWPIHMNGSGNVVFTAYRLGSMELLGTFAWEAGTCRFTVVALKGMPATEHLIVRNPGGFSPAINNSNEIAFAADVRNSAGPSGWALFVLQRDGKVVPILPPGGVLPGGIRAIVHHEPRLSINDAGAVAFLVRRPDESQSSAYLWEKGLLTPLAVLGAGVPGGGTLSSVAAVFLNNRNRTAIVAAGVDGSWGHGLYRVVAGKLIPLAVPGQEMPGGGRLRTLQGVGGSPYYCSGLSTASETGEHAFLGFLEDGRTAAYRVDATGKLSLLLKSGAATLLGTITDIGLGSPPSINSKGEAALCVRIDDGPATLVLLSPRTP